LIHENAEAQEQSCLESFHTGSFRYESESNTIYVERTKTKHVETFNNGSSKIIMRVNWLTDSTYTLTLQKLVNAPGCLIKADVIMSRITKCSDNSYLCAYETEGCGRVTGETRFFRIIE